MLTKLEIKRQILHIILGLAIIILLNFNLINATILFVIFVVGLILSLSSRKFNIPLIHNFLKIFDREKDLKEFPGKGAVFYFLGASLVIFLFPRDIALASIIILAFGDSVSRLVGPYGYLKHPFHNEKFFEGVIAGALVSFLGALIFVSWILALAGAVISMLLEGLDLRIKDFKIDDNLSIPIISAVVMVSLRSLINYL